jgi:hypothetical protein
MASLMENKPLLIGIAVVIVALIVGGYFWWKSRSSTSGESSVHEPVTEEFVGRGPADFEEAQRAVAAEQQHEQAPAEHQHEE